MSCRSRSVTFCSCEPYTHCGSGTPVCFTDSHTTGIMNAMMMMMYCATCVHVTARMPPRKLHTRMLPRPMNTPTKKSSPVRRAAMRPTP